MSDDLGLVHVLGALVSADVDVHDVLHHLVTDIRVATGAAAVAVLTSEDDGLALLAASSHRAAELEMLQAQSRSGPCVESIARNELVRSAGADDLTARWHEVGAAIVEAGFTAVESYPVRWSGESLAGLGIFYAHGLPADETTRNQAYADSVAVTIASLATPSLGHLRRHLDEVMRGRQVIETAKGVLVEREGISLEAAFHRLVEISAATATPLLATAHRVVTLRAPSV